MTIKEKINYLQAIEETIEAVEQKIEWRKEWLAEGAEAEWENEIKAYERLKNELEKLAEKC